MFDGRLESDQPRGLSMFTLMTLRLVDAMGPGQQSKISDRIFAFFNLINMNFLGEIINMNLFY